MATKTANVMARVEPDLKEQAEAIMAQLGIPASVVINTLYRQIVMKKGLPFTLTLPEEPVAREDMDVAAFNTMMQAGFDQAKADQSRPVGDVFAELKQGL